MKNYGKFQSLDEGVSNNIFMATGTGETLKKKSKKIIHKQKSYIKLKLECSLKFWRFVHPVTLEPEVTGGLYLTEKKNQRQGFFLQKIAWFQVKCPASNIWNNKCLTLGRLSILDQLM